MNCQLCGETCHCHSEPLPSAASLSTADQMGVATPDLAPAGQTGTAEPDAAAWRDEIAARLTRFRSRRRMRPPRYPSLRLQFGAAESDESTPSPSAFDLVSHQALALDRMAQTPSAAHHDLRSDEESSGEAVPQGASSPSARAKILEFPRPLWAPPIPMPDQLADPVATRPRILDVPEVSPEPPALGGITIEVSASRESARRPGIDVPLQAASLLRRLFAGAVDGLIVLIASALFGAIFWKVTAVRPPGFELLSLAVGLPCVLWAAYQYLLIVYGANTPGLRLAGLRLARFDGTPTNRSLRRWRVLASFLSAASLGMGFAWASLDEDALCWHDRITHTYLGPRSRRP